MIKKMYLTMLILAIINVSCSKDNDDTVKLASLTLNLNGLESLGDNFVYEGWIIVNGNPVSTGTFTSVSFPQTFMVDATQLEMATKFVLSIEPAVDADPNPSESKIMAGDFSGNLANVNSNNTVGDFGSVSGKYILATPTDGSDNNELSGVWFLDLSSGSPEVGLDLPDLPSGWKYEGWSVIGGMAVSTGKFENANGFDDNATTTPFKGSLGDGPPFPGEDYLQNAPSGLSFPTDLRNATIVISVEPDPDNSSDPFTLKPLAHVVPANASDHETIEMGIGPNPILEGNVTR